MYSFVIIVLVTLCNTAVNKSWHGIVPPTYERNYHNGHASDHQKRWPEWHNGHNVWDFPDYKPYPRQWNDFDDSGEFWKDQSGTAYWDEDHWVYLEPNNANVEPRIPVSSSTAASAISESTTRSVLSTLLCIRSCPVTPEYNPVCGTNNITYNNPGKLECAKHCGVDVGLRRSSPCPRITSNSNSSNTVTGSSSTTPTPENTVNSTVTPINEVKPTRYTTIDISSVNGKPDPTEYDSSDETKDDSDSNASGFTISDDILASIFENTSKSSVTVAPEFSFDLRMKDDRYIFT